MKTTLLMLVISAIAFGATLGNYVGDYFFSKQESNLLMSTDHINEDQIEVYDDSATISLSNKNLRWARYANTDSMLPLLDEGYNGLEFVPERENEINVGDVISFEYMGNNYVHRVIEIGNDVDGWYALTKGDSNDFVDEGKRRFQDVNGVLVGVIF